MIIGDGNLPSADAEGVEIRAALIRMLLLGLDPELRLHEIGHREDARDVLMRKAFLQRRSNLQIARLSPDPRADLGSAADYRHRGGLSGHMECRRYDAKRATCSGVCGLDRGNAVAPGKPGAFWSSPGRAGQDYETFNAYAYAADLLIPIVNLRQEEAWAPSTSRSPWGRNAW